MAQKVPGLTGYRYARISSMDGRAIGKFTDLNHLSSLQHECPADYDKKIISLYTQSMLYSNDFLDMINKSEPWYIPNGSDSWQWEAEVPFQFAKIVDVPATTTSQDGIGSDGKAFEIVLDFKYAENDILSLGSRRFGKQVFVIQDPTAYGRGWLHKVMLVSDNPINDFLDPHFLLVGTDVEKIHNSIGEFDQKLSGLPKMADKLKLYESLGSAYGVEHTITGWADDKILRDEKGNPLDILMYANPRIGAKAVTKNSLKWEPLVDALARQEMMSMKVNRMVWAQGAANLRNQSTGEIKRVSDGIYWKMRKAGQYVPFNKGEFSAQLIRTVFGDLFYRRVSIANRRVKLYTNEAGFDVFNKAMKEDAANSGITLVSDVNAISSGTITAGDPSQHRIFSFAFDGMYSRDTGLVELIHLQELDQPSSSLEYGQNIKSAPVFFVFDVSPERDGNGLSNNIREVRLQGRPNMTFGYIDGRRHHLGAFASQGHSAANKFDGYTLFFDDRADIFIEDLSRCVLIEEIPQAIL